MEPFGNARNSGAALPVIPSDIWRYPSGTGEELSQSARSGWTITDCICRQIVLNTKSPSGLSRGANGMAACSA